MKDIRQSLKYGQYMEKIGWRTAEHEVESRKYKQSFSTNQAFIRKLPLGFSIIKVQRPEQINFVQLDQLAKSHHALLVSVEPQTEELVPQLLQHGFRMNKGGMIPSKTRQIDLKPSEEEIFQTFNRTRKYKIGRAIRNNFKVVIDNHGPHPNPLLTGEGIPNIVHPLFAREGRVSSAIDDFVDLWSQNALKRGFWVPIKNQIKALYETFGKDAYLILAYPKVILRESEANREVHESRSRLRSNNNLLAGILLIIEEKTAHYFYAASSPLGRNLCAPSLLTWEAMKLAKKKGCTIFDFEGIYDERFPQKSWQGFSYFKESFGGEILSYPGRFIKTQGLLSRLFFL